MTNHQRAWDMFAGHPDSTEEDMTEARVALTYTIDIALTTEFDVESFSGTPTGSSP